MLAVKPKIVGVFLMGLLVAVSVSHAENAPPVTVSVSGQDISLLLPEGACAYDRSNPLDARIIDMLEKANQGYNQVLLAFVDCNDLKSLHLGKQAVPTGDYGQILFPSHGQDVQDIARTEYVKKATDVYRNDAGVYEQGTGKAKDILKSVTNGELKVSGSKMLGVIRTDPDFVQIGMLQTLEAGDTSLPLAAVITSTKLNMPVTINLYHTYTDDASLNALADRAAGYTRRLIALNPEKPGLSTLRELPGLSSGWKEILFGGLVGAVFGGIVQAIYNRRKKGNPKP
jgi:hypothetical protein